MKNDSYTVSKLLRRIKKGKGSIPKNVVIGTLKSSIGADKKGNDIESISPEETLKSIRTLINTVSIIKHNSSTRIAYTIFEYITENYPDYLDDDDYRLLINSFISNNTYLKCVFSYHSYGTDQKKTAQGKEKQTEIFVRTISEDKLKSKVLSLLVDKKGRLVIYRPFTATSHSKKQSLIGMVFTAMNRYPEWLMDKMLKYDNGLERLIDYIEIFSERKNHRSRRSPHVSSYAYGVKNVVFNGRLKKQMNNNGGLRKISKKLVDDNTVIDNLDMIMGYIKNHGFMFQKDDAFSDITWKREGGTWVIEIYKFKKRITTVELCDDKVNGNIEDRFGDMESPRKYLGLLKNAGYSFKTSINIKVEATL